MEHICDKQKMSDRDAHFLSFTHFLKLINPYRSFTLKPEKHTVTVNQETYSNVAYATETIHGIRLDALNTFGIKNQESALFSFKNFMIEQKIIKATFCLYPSVSNRFASSSFERKPHSTSMAGHVALSSR